MTAANVGARTKEQCVATWAHVGGGVGGGVDGVLMAVFMAVFMAVWWRCR
jgi:hypothetical protein